MNHPTIFQKINKPLNEQNIIQFNLTITKIPVIHLNLSEALKLIINTYQYHSAILKNLNSILYYFLLSLQVYKMNQMQKPVKYLLKDIQKHLKSLLWFVGKTQDLQSAIFLFYNDDNTSPEKLLHSYNPYIQSKTPWTGMFSALVNINNKPTAIFALDRSFLSLREEGCQLSDKDLIIFYLLKKYKQVRFCFCLDKDAIKDSSFRVVKQLFEQWAYMINYGNLKSYSQSFMMLILHKMDKSIIETAKNRLGQSVKDKGFYKENHQFVGNVCNSMIKQNKFLEINKDLKPEEMSAKKKEFQKLISLLKPIQFAAGDKGMPLTNLFLNALKKKSVAWKFLEKSQKGENLNKSEVQKTQSSTSSMKQKQQGTIQNLFVIWQDIFNQTIGFLIKKLKNPNESFETFHGLTKFLLDEECDKYLMDIKDLSSSSKKSQFCIAKLFSRVLNYLQKVVNLKGKQFLNDFQKFRQMNKSVQGFLSIFYQSKVFGQAEKTKTLFDSFRIYSSLFQTLFPVQRMQLINSLFFNDNMLISMYICDMPIILRNFLECIAKIFIRQVQVQLSKVRKGEHVELEGLLVPMRKIKEHVEKGGKNVGVNQKSIYSYLPLQRILATINQYQSLLLQQQIQKLSKTPGARVKVILQSFCKQQLSVDKLQTLVQLTKSIFDYLDENKLMYDGNKVPLRIKRMLVQMLALEPKEMNQVIMCYERQFEGILRKHRKSRMGLTQQQAEFVTSFAEYLIKVGFVEKSRQVAHFLGQVDGELSQKMMLRSLLKTSHKQQFEFIKNQPSSDTKVTLNHELTTRIDQISEFFRKTSQQLEARNKQIDSHLLDI